MIVSRTPVRVSFAGGGSDLRSFYQHEPGAVVSTTIDKYVYLTVNPTFDGRIRISGSTTELVDSLDDIQNDVARETIRFLGIQSGIGITSTSDIPSQGTGLGSSSSYTVGLLNALHAHLGRHAGAERLANEACHIEIDCCGNPIGKQDQYIVAFGGLQFIQFNPNGSVAVDPIVCNDETRRQLCDSMLLFYTGMTRSTADVLREQESKLNQDPGSHEAIRRLVQLAGRLRVLLELNDLSSFGEILHEGWMIKRTLASTISTDSIDRWYERGRAAGAAGGKILGAGGGGFLLLFADPDRHAGITAALSDLRRVPVRLESSGSAIVYSDVAERYCDASP